MPNCEASSAEDAIRLLRIAARVIVSGEPETEAELFGLAWGNAVSMFGPAFEAASEGQRWDWIDICESFEGGDAMSQVKAKRVEDIGANRHIPGAFRILVDDLGAGSMMIVCPCGCQSVSVLALRGLDAMPWDQNRQEPTFGASMSLPGHWAGTLRVGVWERA